MSNESVKKTPTLTAAAIIAGPRVAACLLRERFRLLMGRNRFLKNTLLLASGTAMGHGINFLSMMALARLYSVEAMAVYGLFFAFFRIAATAGCLRYDIAIISASNRREAVALMLACLCFIFPISALSAGVLFYFSSHDIFGFGLLPRSASVIMFVTLVITGAQTAGRYWTVRGKQFRLLSRIAFVQASGRTLVQVAGGLFHGGWFWLALGETGGRFAGNRALYRYSRRAVQLFRRVTFEDLKRVVYKYRRFSLFSLPSVLIENAASVLAVPLLVYSHGVRDAGFFSLAQRIWYVPITIVGLSVAEIFHSSAAQIYHRTPEKLAAFFWKITLRISLIALIPTLLVHFFGVPFSAVYLGKKWLDVGKMLSLIAPWYFMEFLEAPLNRMSEIVQAQHLKLVCNVISIGLIYCNFRYAKALGLSADTTISHLSTIMFCMYGCHILLLGFVVSRISRQSRMTTSFPLAEVR